MQITIIATFDESQLWVIATKKNYNPESGVSPADFVTSFYEQIIKDDLTREFISFMNEQTIRERVAQEKWIRDLIESSIISKVE